MGLINTMGSPAIERLLPGQRPEDDPAYQPVVARRPLASTLDTYDNNFTVDYQRDAFLAGRRPMWNIPVMATTASKVGTIKSSANVAGTSPAYAIVSGFSQSPITNVNTFSVIPNMAQQIHTSGPLQVNFSVNLQTVNSADPVSVAVFRNGLQVSQTYQSSGNGNTNFLMSGSFTDNPPLGRAVYDVRWKNTASKVTASGTQRTLQLLNLRAQ